MYRPTVEDMTFTKSFQQLSCHEAGQFDHTHKLREKLTGWGKVCRERNKAKISRRARLDAR
jgi:hypothetical protein